MAQHYESTFKEHEVLYNSLFNMTLQSHSQAMCYLTNYVFFTSPLSFRTSSVLTM